MKLNFRRVVMVLLGFFSVAGPPLCRANNAVAQTSEIGNLFHDLEVKAQSGIANTDEADPLLEQLTKSSRKSVIAALPLIRHATVNSYFSVRRIAALALYQIATRPDGQALLSTEAATFAALLTDSDIPIRRVVILTVATLRPDASSPLVSTLETYLAREDAVSTIGAGVATVLMQAAPDNAENINAVARYMKRKDQDSASRNVLMDAITYVAKSHNREIGREVASYADDPDEQTGVHAIVTLQGMGRDVVADNQQLISRIAEDSRRAPSVRAAATKALSAVQ